MLVYFMVMGLTFLMGASAFCVLFGDVISILKGIFGILLANLLFSVLCELLKLEFMLKEANDEKGTV